MRIMALKTESQPSKTDGTGQRDESQDGEATTRTEPLANFVNVVFGSSKSAMLCVYAAC